MSILDDFGLEPHPCKTVKAGNRFGRLTILAIGKVPKTYRYKAVCQCDCGSAPKAIRMDAVVSGDVVSCGCFISEHKKTHGFAHHPFYQRWLRIMYRCYDPEHHAYRYYGARGIKVCARWHDIRNFIADISDGYFEGATLDRINNDGDYEPLNIRWATRSVQSNNRRSLTAIEFNGKTQTVTAWSRETGITKDLSIVACAWDGLQSAH